MSGRFACCEEELAEWEREAEASVKARAEADAVAWSCGLNRVPPSKHNARTLALIAEVRALRAALAAKETP